MTGSPMLSRHRKVALIIALLGVLGVLCCGGSVSALLLTSIDNEEEQSLTFSAAGCGGKGPVDPKSDMSAFGGYSEQQIRNAAIIINTGARLGVPPRGWVIAIATAMQESGLTNLGFLGDRNDHDSLGLFQQRPSAGWGTPTQVRDPNYAATRFYKKMVRVKNWQRKSLTRVAQSVQVSAYPDAYAKHEALASQIVNLLADGAARADGYATEMVCSVGNDIAASGWTNPWSTKESQGKNGVVGSGFRTSDRPDHQGVDLILGRYTPIVAAADGRVSVVECNVDRAGEKTCDSDGFSGKGGCGWMVEIVHAGNVMTRYCHMVEHPAVSVGQRVTAGQQIGRVGTSGDSSGPHLHFEVHLNNDGSSFGATDPVDFMREHGASLGSAV